MKDRHLSDGSHVEARRPTVINLTSSVAYRGSPGSSAYASSKAALDATTSCWAATYAWCGVLVAASSRPRRHPAALPDFDAEDITAFCSLFGMGRYAGDMVETLGYSRFRSDPCQE